MDEITITGIPTNKRHEHPAMRWCLLAFKGAGFSVWLAGTTVLITSLMAGHLLPLPAPDRDVAAMAAAPCWRAVHVLAAGCPCSEAVLDHLIDRGSTTGIDELVYVAGGPKDTGTMTAKLSRRGYRVLEVTPERLLKSLAVRGAPWLLWIDPQGRTRYSGGYSSERPRPGVGLQDLAILRRLRAGEQIAPNPAFGCAVDPSLKRTLDPLSLTNL